MDMFADFTAKVGEVKSKATSDYSKTPQRFNIKGRQIREKKLLSQGAFGFIWLAQDVNSKQQFALKRVICMTEQSYQAALLQKNIYDQLPQSEHIVGYYGGLSLKHQGKTVVITLMELCSNGNLFDMLQKMEGKGITQTTIKEIARSVLKGLIVLHKIGFVHRDIKIQNILLNKDKKMKICDFGSCTKQIIDFSQIPKSQHQSIQQSIFSYTTPMYRPPEIVDPYLKFKVSQKADIWMLGCVLYTMCYFVHPFVESNSVGIAHGIFRFPEYPSETQYKVSEKMKDFIRNLLTVNPQYRPSANKMLQILQKWESLENIPLNADAKRLKQEHLKKQQQLKKLNKKVVDHDGDIPLDELMMIQRKLKGKCQKQQKQKNFVTNKETLNLMGGNKKNLQQKCGEQKKTQSFIQKPSQPIRNNKTQQKKVMGFDQWGTFQTKKQQKPNNTDKSINNFNDFDAFVGGSASNISKKPIQSNSNDFMEFFSQSGQSSTINKPKQSPNKQVNLLDL